MAVSGAGISFTLTDAETKLPAGVITTFVIFAESPENLNETGTYDASFDAVTVWPFFATANETPPLPPPPPPPPLAVAHAPFEHPEEHAVEVQLPDEHVWSVKLSHSAEPL